MNYILDYIRRHILLYIFFITVYKKFINIFFIIERNKYIFIKNSKINNILDIGSNNYQTTKIFLKIKKNVKIICYDSFKIQNQIKNVIFNNHLLSNKNGMIKFFIPYYNNFELSSLASVSRKFQNDYFHRNRINTKKIYFKEKYIICKKLDNKNLNFQFIKIDAEGSELQIIRGGYRNLKKNNPIILLEKNKDFFKIKKILKKLKYKQYNYYNYNKKIFENLKNNKKFDNIYFLNNNSFKYL